MKEVNSKSSVAAGQKYEATVPDTLDLTSHCELAINAITGSVNEKLDYEYIWVFNMVPPIPHPHSNQWFDSNPRGLWDLILMRAITGSVLNIDKEKAMIESMFSRIGEDGFFYNAPYRDNAPWRKGGAEYCRPIKWKTDEEITNVGANAMMLIALIALYQRDKDPEILKRCRKLAEGLIRIAICKDDYAYYPATPNTGIEFAYFKDTGWPDTAEAEDDTASAEGAVSAYIAIVIRALLSWYKLTKEQNALGMAGKLVKYMMQPRFWGGNLENWGEGLIWELHGGSQRKPAAIFKGHLTAVPYTLDALIIYAMEVNDTSIMEFVRQGYEYYRNLGLARIGMWGENIANNMIAAVAIKLSDAGVGDYFEDVDQYIRNTMIEDQYTDLEQLQKLCKERGVPIEKNGRSIKQLLGGLRWHSLIDRQGTIDPTEKGVHFAGPYFEPFYFVWESIVRYKNDTARINLLLNRVSSWLDIESYLPYEGKVVIRNKAAKNMSIRIPRWVHKAEVICKVNDAETSFFWTGNYITLINLKATDVITVEFPMVETIEKYYTLDFKNADANWYKDIERWPKYILHLKGNTCIKVEFPNKKNFSGRYNDPDFPVFMDGFTSEQIESGLPIFQREHYKQNKAPMKKVTQFIAENLIDW